MTPQRIAILDAVCMGEGLATLGQIAAAVRRDDATIALSTVYRTLKTFAEVGLIQAAGDGADTVYQIVGPD